MDLVRRPGRLCYRAAEHSLASTASLAHLRTAEQHLPQQQKRRTQPGTIHRAAGRFHESGNAAAMARRPFWLLGSRECRRYRAIGIIYLITLAEFIILHGKSYYLAPAYPMLFAVGGVAIERIFASHLKWLKPVLLSAILVMVALFAPFVVPILPPDKLVAYIRAIRFQPPCPDASHTAALPQVFADQFGWEQMVGSVAHVYHDLHPEDEKRAAIFCQNYGEAGAIDFFGLKLGLPSAISAHQTYFLWGRSDWTGEVVSVLDTDDEDERKLFASVQDLGQIVSSPWAMPFERRTHIFLCRDLKAGVQEFWPRAKKWL